MANQYPSTPPALPPRSRTSSFTSPLASYHKCVRSLDDVSSNVMLFFEVTCNQQQYLQFPKTISRPRTEFALIIEQSS